MISLIPRLRGFFIYSFMKFLNYNGKHFEEGTPIVTADNRGLRYGDGLFETIKYKNNTCLLLDDHLKRLWHGIDLLQFAKPKLFTRQYLRDELDKLIKKNEETSARVRLSIFRGKGGLYDAENDNPQFVIQTMPLGSNTGTFNVNGLQICVYRDALKAADAFSNLKHNNFLPYLMGAQFAKGQKCNDAIILNHHLRICDSTIANIFIIKNGVVHTPPLTEGCVAGVMRQFIQSQLPLIGIEVLESVITEETLLNADEVFLSNSIYNLRWVAGIGNVSYSNKITRSIYEKLAETNADVFC